MNKSHFDNSYYTGGSNGDSSFQLEGDTAKTLRANDKLNVKWVLAQIWYYKWVLLSFIIGFGLAGYFIGRSIQPVYEAHATIILHGSKNQYSYSGSNISNLLTSSYGLGASRSFSNQLAIIRSRRIAEVTADRVLQDSLMPNGKIYPILFTSYPHDSTLISKEHLIGRIGRKMGVARAEQNTDLAKISFKSYSPAEAAGLANLVMDAYTRVSTNKNQQAAKSARNFLRTQKNKIHKQLIQAENEAREFQQKTGFIASNQQGEGSDTQASSAYTKLTQLQQQKNEQKIKLSSLNKAEKNYVQQLKQIKPKLVRNYSNNVAPMLSELQNKLAKVEARRTVLINKNPGIEDHPENEPQLQQYNRQINGLKESINQRANAIFMSDSSNTSFFSGQQGTSLLSRLQQNLVKTRIEKAQAKAQLSVINSLTDKQKSKLNEVPGKAQQLARLKRQVAMKQELYKSISEQYAQTSLWEQTRSGGGTPLDHATVPGRPVQPNMWLYLFGGLFLGSVAGVGYIFFRIETNTRFDSPERLEEISYPLLSVIPDFSKEDSFQKRLYGRSLDEKRKINKNWITLYDGNSASAEAFRKLQNNILYSKQTAALRTLMVTSSSKGAGKTSVALNLATTIGEASQRVLVIDCDMHRPNLFRWANMDRSPGLRDVIVEGSPVDTNIQSTLHRNVDILSAGESARNPAAILRSNKMAELIDKLKQSYDYIILDTPPLGVVGDAAPLIRYVDGVIGVAKFKETDIGQFHKLIEELEHLDAAILGTVLTGFNPKKSANTYYHSPSYYYDYESYEDYVED